MSTIPEGMTKPRPNIVFFRQGYRSRAGTPGLLRSVRSNDRLYIRDPDYGDEAYDLRSDPKELCNLLNSGSGPPALDDLRLEMDHFETSCLQLRDRLGVIPGPRGFEEGWE